MATCPSCGFTARKLVSEDGRKWKYYVTGVERYSQNNVNVFTEEVDRYGRMVLCQDLVQVKMRNFSPF